MPRFDRTGPEGTGPRTGWGDGNCPVEPVEEMAQNADTGIPWHLMRHRAFFLRWGWPRLGNRGRSGRGPGRGRRGNWS